MRTLLAAVLAISLAGCTTSVRSYTRMVDRVSASLLHVTNDNGSCTGEVIAPQRVLTAAHCLGPHMQADGLPALVLKADESTDLALLSAPTDKPVLVLRDTPAYRFESLTALGYGFGWGRLTVLQVRALIPDIAPGPEIAAGLIVQTGYVPGMSGGAVVDGSGRMVGIVQQANQGLGYGVTTLTIRAFLLGVE